MKKTIHELDRELLQRNFLSGDRYGYAEARWIERNHRLRKDRWTAAMEICRSLEANLTLSPEAVAHNFGRLRALVLELGACRRQVTQRGATRTQLAYRATLGQGNPRGPAEGATV